MMLPKLPARSCSTCAATIFDDLPGADDQPEPVFRIGAQIDEVIALHDGEGKSKEDIKKRTVEMLEMVGIANSRVYMRCTRMSCPAVCANVS